MYVYKHILTPERGSTIYLIKSSAEVHLHQTISLFTLLMNFSECLFAVLWTSQRQCITKKPTADWVTIHKSCIMPTYLHTIYSSSASQSLLQDARLVSLIFAEVIYFYNIGRFLLI